MARKVQLNLRGLEEVAKSTRVRREIQQATERIADNVRGQGIQVGVRFARRYAGSSTTEALPVRTTIGTTDDMRVDRAQGRVSLAHPAGAAVQAKYGALTKAAAQAGLKVRKRRS